MVRLADRDMLMQMVMEYVTIKGLLIVVQPIVVIMAGIPDSEYER